LAECDRTPHADATDNRLIAALIGHVGDGNFHLAFVVNMEDAAEVARTEGVLQRLAERALAMEGTCTGEHGVGQGKMKYLEAEHGTAALEAMRAIKRVFDPDDIMNPG